MAAPIDTLPGGHMKSSASFRAWVLAAGLAVCLFAAGTALAQLPSKTQYTRLDPPRPVATGPRIEVIEFFYYGCPICYELQPHMSRWLIGAPNYIAHRRVPVLSSEGWEPFAKLFYTLESMGELARLHWPVYDNFHFDGVQLNQEKVMLDWVARNGIDRDKFAAVYNSDAIKAKLDETRALMKTYDVRGVPTIVVDGKYVSSARMAGGTRQLMQTVDELVRQARKERPN
jgi:thiol:disulfide interchange protein DsbA